jgi:tetratricopeptide (TPR) repeat protein
MISWRPASKKPGIIGVSLLLLCLASAGPVFSVEDSPAAVIVTVGIGAVTTEDKSPDAAAGPSVYAVAGKKAVLSYLYEVLGPEEFFRLESAVDTLILPEYQKYITNIQTIAVSPLPGGDVVMVTASVTVDAAALAAYLENIKKLDAKPEAPRALSDAERENLVSRAQAIYIQGEVASDILLDRLRGIESFLSARTFFETAGSADGVYRCMMGTGRARAAMGDVTAARADFDRALELAAGIGRADYAAAARIARARLMTAAGDRAGAAREMDAVFAEESLADFTTLFGEALLVRAELDYRGRDYESAADNAGRAVAVFEGLADAGRLIQAQLLRGLVLVAENDGPGAVAAFKLAMKLADRLDDKTAAVKALVGMSRTYRIAGDAKTASLYLTDALKTAREAGWGFGEIAVLCESAYVHLGLGDGAAAETDAAAARDLAAATGDPVLTAASLFALGEACRARGNDEAAFEAFLSCAKTASDIRVTGRNAPFLLFGDAPWDTALSRLLDLSITLDRQKKAVAVLAGYEGSSVAREVLADPPDVAGPDAERIRLFRDAAGRVIAASDAALGADFVKTADTSRSETARLSVEAEELFENVRARIVRESPGLAALLGMENPDPGGLSRAVPEGCALVHYVINGGGAFAVIAAGREVSVLRIEGGHDEIAGLCERVRDAAAVYGGAGEIPLAFSEPATALASLLVTPVVAKLSGVTAIGISPPSGLTDLPIQALGRYDDVGGFVFAGEDYTLFYTSWLFPRAAAPVIPGPDGYDVIVIGDVVLPDLNDMGGPEKSPESDAEDTALDQPPAPEAEDITPGKPPATLRIVRYLPDSPWGGVRARIAVCPEAEAWGSSDFIRTEYLSFRSRVPVLVIPAGIGPDGPAAFLKAALSAPGGAILPGYADAVRAAVLSSRSGGPRDWSLIKLVGDFVSEQR